MLHKIIFLIISSKGEYYDNLRSLQRIYLKNYLPQIRYFFVEFTNDNIFDENCDIIEIDDYIYLRGDESINPGMIIKTCYAINYINNKYKYEFLIRTNLSTLFIMPNIMEYISIIPTTNACGGFSYRSFITGSCVILTCDVTFKIIENFNKYDIINNNEDLIVSMCLHTSKVPYYNCNKFYKWGFCIDVPAEDNQDYHYFINDGIYNENITIPENILHIRIKSNNRSIDIKYFKLFLFKIYNICINFT